MVKTEVTPKKPVRGGFGSMLGEWLFMSEAFDVPLAEFAEYQ